MRLTSPFACQSLAEAAKGARPEGPPDRASRWLHKQLATLTYAELLLAFIEYRHPP